MPAVTLNKGRYFVGNPLTIFPDWVPSPSHTYRVGMHTFYAFQFDDGYVAAIPEAAIPESLTKTKKQRSNMVFMTFDQPTIFFEQLGEGAIGNYSL